VPQRLRQAANAGRPAEGLGVTLAAVQAHLDALQKEPAQIKQRLEVLPARTHATSETFQLHALITTNSFAS
jgi:hypothetical protein